MTLQSGWERTCALAVRLGKDVCSRSQAGKGPEDFNGLDEKALILGALFRDGLTEEHERMRGT